MNDVATLLMRLVKKPNELMFVDVIATIDRAYRFAPTAFSNGTADNTAEQNQGSAKVLAFARLHNLGESQTLACWAEHYRSVLDHPEGTDHQNIRQFIQTGWAGVQLPSDCLVLINQTVK